VGKHFASLPERSNPHLPAGVIDYNDIESEAYFSATVLKLIFR
jgi:hypothetical protein